MTKQKEHNVNHSRTKKRRGYDNGFDDGEMTKEKEVLEAIDKWTLPKHFSYHWLDENTIKIDDKWLNELKALVVGGKRDDN